MLRAPLLTDGAQVRLSSPARATGDDEDENSCDGDAEREGPRHRYIMTVSASRGNGKNGLHPPSDAAEEVMLANDGGVAVAAGVDGWRPQRDWRRR
jgi:hypothetical protein